MKSLVLILIFVAASHATLGTVGAGDLSARHVQERFRKQSNAIKSLQIRVRNEVRSKLAPSTVRMTRTHSWRPGHEEIIFGYKGAMRYFRRLELKYERTSESTAFNSNLKVDEAVAWTGDRLLRRTRDLRSRKFVYSESDTMSGIPKFTYLFDIGLSLGSLTANKKIGIANLGSIASLLERHPYKVTQQIARIDDTDCLLIEATIPLSTINDSTEIIKDKIWLDRGKKLAIRKREIEFKDEFVRISNRDFVELLTDVWIPKQVLAEHWKSRTDAVRNAENPRLSRNSRALIWVINQVPDGVFDIALTKPEKRPAPLTIVSAYHYRDQLSNTEIWGVRNVGRRIERRNRSGKLSLVIIDTPKWYVEWEPMRDRATVWPTRLNDERVVNKRVGGSNWIANESEKLRSCDELTAIFSSRMETLGDRKLIKLTAHCPADPATGGNTHNFSTIDQLATEGKTYRTRNWWFDPSSKLTAGFQCGCDANQKRLKSITRYPKPSEVPRKLFSIGFLKQTKQIELIHPTHGIVEGDEAKAILEL